MIYTITLGSTAWAVPSEGHQMVAAGPSPAMIEAVRDIASADGNVIDAAVASALTLAVTSPYYAALGGGGFALIKVGDKVEALDFRETAPAATNPQFYADKPASASLKGGAAIGVPGLPAGLWALHKKYGKLPWKRLFHVPLKFAQEGFWVSGEWARLTREEKENFNDAGRKFFFKHAGVPYKAGERLKQIALAQALIELRNKGEVGFYRGAIASDLIKTVGNTGGVMTMDDLKNYRVRWLEPLSMEFQGHKIFLMPPPSSGGLVLKTALALSEKLHLEKSKTLSVEELHLIGQILSRSFRGRALLGDPDFHKNPLEQLSTPAYLNELAGSIRRDKATTVSALKDAPLPESTQTTHFSIVDKNGKAVAFTVTLNGNYGSRVVTERFGIALNNEMDDFTTHPGQANQFGLIQGQGNVVQAGKRPLSSMSPTLVEKNGRVVLALGSPGGPRIISAVYQALYRHLVSGLNIDEAIQLGRVHHQFMPNKLFLDEKRFSPETLAALQARGHVLEAGYVGKVYMVRVSEDGNLEAAYDSRGEGSAGGL
ncbi:MAG: gamma-glutamyltransferase [Bdellovibrionales bacterium]